MPAGRPATADRTRSGAYARGAEALGGSYYLLDMTALGRQEEWEEPKDRGGDGRPAIPDFST